MNDLPARKDRVPAFIALHGAIRIADAASIGISGNQPRLEHARRALFAFTKLHDAAERAAHILGIVTPAENYNGSTLEKLREALALCEDLSK